MYVDGIYQSRARQFTQSMVDLQQVEVLRGPQGTLFGKNTIAGAIKVETATTRPGDALEGSVTMDYEPDQETARGTLVIGGSPTDTLGARLAVRYQDTDGYVHNEVWDRDEASGDDTMARFSLAWDPTDSLRVVGKVSYTEMDRDGIEVINTRADYSLLQRVQQGDVAPGFGLLQVGGVIAAASVPGYQASTGNHKYDTWSANPRYNNGDTEETDSTQASLRFDYDFGDYTLTGLSGYSDFNFTQDHDVDFHPGNAVQNFDDETLNLYSQELRLASNFDGPLNFIAGLYYEKQKLDALSRPIADGSLGGVFGKLPASAVNPALPSIPLELLGINSIWSGAVLGALAGIPPAQNPLFGTEVTDLMRTSEFNQDTETKAVFVDASYDVIDGLTLELGLRYSEDTKDVRNQTYIGFGTPSDYVVTTGSDGLPTGNAGPLETALVKTIWGLPQLGTYVHDQDLYRKEDHLDPSARLRWEISDDTMAYLSWSQGYKSGGFNNSSDTSLPNGEPGPGTEFEDEEAEAWELGVKSSLLDGRANVTAALFHTEITNLQVTSFIGLQFRVGNAAEMTSQGLELEGQFAVSDSLTIGSSLQYLDAQYDSFPNGPVTSYQQADGIPFQDLGGESTPFAPDWSGTAFADYTTEISSQWRLLGHLELNYKDDFYTSGDLDPDSLQDSYVKINARVALVTLDEQWEIALYGRNLTDEQTVSASVNAPLSAGILAAWAEEPRVYGAQIRYSF